jgi:hypothetical protein
VLGVAAATPASAQCSTPFGDVNSDGATNVIDAQCSILLALWQLGGQAGPIPTCAQGNPSAGDVNCDNATTVADVTLVINTALNVGMSATIDPNGNGCPDACDALLCGDGTCQTFETVSGCWQDCAGSDDCCTVSTSVGCSNLAVQATVCAVDIFCCEDSWDLGCVNQAETLGGSCTGACCADNGTPGCNSTGDVLCEDCVCAVDATCCTLSWDAECAAIANNASCAAACGCVPPPVKGSCCTDNDTPGCTGLATEVIVCAADPFCCSTRWDSICAGQAETLANTCTGDCCAANGTPGCDSTGEIACEECVCAADPFCCNTAWDSACAGAANAACATECECGVVLEGSCCTDNAGPGCLDAAVEAAVCAVDPFCCNTRWDLTCALEAETIGGSCTGDCCTANGTPGCNSTGNIDCEECICGADPFCCNTAWDLVCANAANGATCGVTCGCVVNPCGDGVCDAAIGEDIVTCPEDCTPPAKGSCCTDNDTAGCLDAVVEAAVCAADAFCCNSRWDSVCAGEAETIGNSCTGDCCTANGTPGCNSTGNVDCEECICAADPFCCNTAWDLTCATSANGATCGITCGCVVDPCGDGVCDAAIGEDIVTCPEDCTPPAKGSCCTDNEIAGCLDAAVEAAVCAVDAFCCNTRWDATCAFEAETIGGSCTGDCCTANGTPGCNSTGNIDCEECICGADPFCCNTAWDLVCANAANGATCGVTCGCVIDPCGDGVCDAAIGEDIVTCPEDCAPPPKGPCCTNNLSAGCLDANVEAAVCAVDPFCCNTRWDGTCALEAETIGGSCTGDCCAANGTPGCNSTGNTLCEECICDTDPFCCNTAWDTTCALSAAGATCGVTCGCVVNPCGDGVCDAAIGENATTCPADCAGPAKGSCCTNNETPGCLDPAVEAAVCALDPFCCNSRWDSICAGEAETIGGSCTGNCCESNGTPGCSSTGNIDCEECVCASDSFCCTSAWDATCASAANAAECGPACGCVATEGSCCTSNDTPGCTDNAVEAIVCANDAFCCETRWDAVCAGLAETLANTCNGDCCAENATPGCSSTGNVNCEGCVCEIDAFCCSNSWDAFCVGISTGAECGITCGCVADPCGDGVCDAAIGENATTCPEDCSAPVKGSCCLINATAGCADPAVEATVCAADPFCCTTNWDLACTQQAETLAGACIGDCCTAHAGAGCNSTGNLSCEQCVCGADAFCCNNSWDSLCAGAANGTTCGLACGCTTLICGDSICSPEIGETFANCPADCTVTKGSCCTVNNSAGCSDATVEAAVCAADPFCCANQWDSVCAGEAETIGGSCMGDCCTADDTPGCSSTGNVDCENCVCAFDGFCCTTFWDATCAGCADGTGGVAACQTAGGCATQCGCGGGTCGNGQCDAGEDATNCPADCGGGCCGTLGGVNNFCPEPACTACVCPLDPFCCDTGWDTLCGNAANTTCAAQCGCGQGEICGNGTCGAGESSANCPADCGGPCCASLGGSGNLCPDAPCASCVCAIDPFCCNTGWDSLCGTAATNNCSTQCNCL